ncbi:UvrD-helicase domain-containing protein [Nocardiopsis sp. ATB16-24]|uniref:UvrD-helicase domain-containing protein n=1 Tax=Nocardiopsis sp. ATB16-24 TaxID=3019555 RepID=UPI002554E044|nr:UvrD-helicase domain-containing protein [Nocardiopsis sp. ATB16-24]
MSHRLQQKNTEADERIGELLDHPIKSGFVVIAGAGSGKTTSLVKALAHIGRRHGARLRREGRRVACITYTHNAVEEIRQDIGGDDLFHVSTIHSFLWEVVKPFQNAMRQWTQGRIEKLMKEKREHNAKPRTHDSTRVENERAVAKLTKALEKLQEPDVRLRYGAAQDYGQGVLGHSDVVAMFPDLIERYPNLAVITAQAFPYVLVDESQDTAPRVVEALTSIERHERGRFCLGFFGDPMQQIYGTGVGIIDKEPTWSEIPKPQNWRCPQRVLDVVNNIRDGSPRDRGPRQERGPGAPDISGNADLFVLDVEGKEEEQLARVRGHLSREQNDPAWLGVGEQDVKMLVLEHRLAARRLGFEELHEAFGKDRRLAERFVEGDHWSLRSFLTRIIPLAEAVHEKKGIAALALLREFSPRLEPFLRGTESAEVLPRLKEDTEELAGMLVKESRATVREVFEHVTKCRLLRFDRRLASHLRRGPAGAVVARPEVEQVLEDDMGHERSGQPAEGSGEDLKAAMVAYLDCPAVQVLAYRDYIAGRTPYQTHQGVKGAEFERVLVLLEDDRSKHYQFSYERLFGLKEPTKREIENLERGEDTILERTRRLFYVACSRAERSLAVVLFTKDTRKALETLRKDSPFPAANVHGIDDLEPQRPPGYGLVG